MPRMKKILTLQTLLLAVALTGCSATNYGDGELKLRMATVGKDIMWVPSKIDIVHKMLDAVQVQPSDIVYDLGSGDGIITIEAAKKYGARAVGIEYNGNLVALAQRNAQRAGLPQERVSFRQGDVFVEDFSEATVVTLYMGESINARLMPKLLKLRPGTRVVSNTFRIESWIPDRELSSASGDVAFVWTVPAPVEGRWDITGIPDARAVTLQVSQKKQFFNADIEFDGKRVARIDDGVIAGTQMSLEFTHANKKYSLRGRVEGSRFSGRLNDDPRLPVSGVLRP
jgi:precorrin-6B methylase 2